MKILYAVQATGNGHISKAMELLPHLEEYGVVDIFLSGNNSNLKLEAPIKYRSKGLSFYYNKLGMLDYFRTVKNIRISALNTEINSLPVEKYDLVINDFEFITSRACARKKVKSINFGHQASFYSEKVPRPHLRSVLGEWVLKNYAKADTSIGLHFRCYDDNIVTPIIKKEILETKTTDGDYITIYLPAFCEKQLISYFSEFKDLRFEIFSWERTKSDRLENITFFPINKKLFNKSLANCTGIITSAGFETPAETIHLGKKLMVIPVKGQYEQQCNAAALNQMGIQILDKIERDFPQIFYNWLYTKKSVQIDYSNSISMVMKKIFY